MKREREDPKQPELSAENYYDYEARFVKQKREQERINVLPRVIKPAMFAKGEFALGDMRVFSRYTVAPLSSLTCGFVELKPGAHSDPKRMVPSAIAYVLEGSGESIQENARFLVCGRRRGYHSAVHDASICREPRRRVSRLAAASENLARPRAFMAGTVRSG